MLGLGQHGQGLGPASQIELFQINESINQRPASQMELFQINESINQRPASQMELFKESINHIN